MRIINWCFLLIAMSLLTACGKSDQEEMQELSDKVNHALAEQNYFEAYAALDNWFFLKDDNKRNFALTLNETAIKNEIATAVQESLENAEESGNYSAKIIFVIKERVRCIDDWDLTRHEYSEKKKHQELLKFAIELANSSGNAQLAQKLQNALTQYEAN